MRLKGKVALVTGAGRGIGKAIAEVLGAEGARVVVNYNKSQKQAEEVVNTIKAAGSEALSIQADVSKEEDVNRLVTETVKAFGKIDILVNNAGIAIDLPLAERTVEHWEETLRVNLIGTFLCCKYAYAQMNKEGRIINISSSNGLAGMSAESIDYDSSKAGVIVLTRNLAREYAVNSVLVNSIAPGWVDTDMNKSLPEDYLEEERQKIYVKRFAEPEEIAKVALFLASDDSSYVNGTTILADGGYS